MQNDQKKFDEQSAMLNIILQVVPLDHVTLNVTETLTLSVIARTLKEKTRRVKGDDETALQRLYKKALYHIN